MLIAISIFITNIYSQDLVTFDQTPSCDNTNNGTLFVSIDQTLLDPGWILPFELNYRLLSNGEVNSLELTSFNSTINNLKPGEYEVVIDFSDQCDYSIYVEIEHEIEIDIKILLQLVHQMAQSI